MKTALTHQCPIAASILRSPGAALLAMAVAVTAYLTASTPTPAAPITYELQGDFTPLSNGGISVDWDTDPVHMGGITGTFTFDFEALQLLAVDLTVTGIVGPGTYTNPVFVSTTQIEEKNDGDTGDTLEIDFDNPLMGAKDQCLASAVILPAT